MLRASAEKIVFRSVFALPCDDAKTAPQAFVIEIDNVTILLDCGWDDDFSPEYIHALVRVAPHVDAVLLSSSNHRFSGALPVVAKYLRPHIPIFAPQALAKIAVNNVLARFMSRFANDLFIEANNEHAAIKLQIDDIFTAFRSIREPQGKNTRITNISTQATEGTQTVVRIEAISSGIIGCYCWRLQHQNDDVLYCQEYSLLPSHLVKRFVVPNGNGTLLLGCVGFDKATARAREEQSTQLLREITNTLRWNRDVLIPVAVAGPGVEMAVSLERGLRDKGVQKFKIALVSLQVVELIDRIRTMTDVLRDDVIFEENDIFDNIVLCKTAEAALKVSSPKVVIADGDSLSFGPAAELLQQFLDDKNLIICDSNARNGSNASTLVQRKHEGTLSSQAFHGTVGIRALLTKMELNEYYDRLDQLQEERMTVSTELQPHHRLSDDTEGDVSDESDNEDVSQNGKFSSAMMFPISMEIPTLSRAMLRGEEDGYGIALSDAQLLQIRVASAPSRRVAERNIDLSVRFEGDDAFVGGNKLVNDSQKEANAPAKLVLQRVQSSSVQAAVFLLDFDIHFGKSDVASAEQLLRTQLAGISTFVGLQCPPSTVRTIASVLDKERRRGNQITFLDTSSQEIQLAASVSSFTAELDAPLFREIERSLRSVREARSGGVWQVGSLLAQIPADPTRKRRRGDDAVPQLIVPTTKISSELDGSVFLGALDIPAVTDAAGLQSEVAVGMTSIGGGKMCIRKSASGSITLACMIGAEAFDVRRRLYENFQQAL